LQDIKNTIIHARKKWDPVLQHQNRDTIMRGKDIRIEPKRIG